MPKPLTKKQKLEIMAAESRITGDRISGLPLSALQCIFSFLDMKQAVQVSVLGGTWRDLWATLPVLNFDFKLWKRRNVEEFVYFVDRILLSKHSKIQRLCFSCATLPRAGHYHSWVSAAVELGVEEIDLEIISNELLKVPQSMFSLRTRVLKLRGFDATYVRPVISFTPCDHLKTLQLVHVTFPDGDSNGVLNFNFPVHESLVIIRSGNSSVETLRVSAPLLEKLVLGNCGGKCELKLCSPNLKSFKCTGSMFKDYSLENLPALVSAELDFDTYTEYLYLGSLLPKVYEERKKILDQRIVKVLNGLQSAKILTLSERSLEALAEIPAMLKMLADDGFLALKNLKLEMNSSAKRTYYRYFDPPKANLLNSFRSVETLTIKTDEVCEPEFRFDYASDHLKFVEIQNMKGCESELKFLKFLLENATALERITITTSDIQLKGGQKNFCEKVLAFPRASSSVSVIFMLKITSTT